MTQEEKDILLKDLCMRLPYGVIVEINHKKCVALTLTKDGEIEVEIASGYFRYYDVWDACPYLRPMESMTDDEKKEYSKLIEGFKSPSGYSFNIVDWLNAHYFDYRGLIEMELALPAKEGMYEEGGAK